MIVTSGRDIFVYNITTASKMQAQCILRITSSPYLNITNTNITNSQHLSLQNKDLLLQRGAQGEPARQKPKDEQSGSQAKSGTSEAQAPLVPTFGRARTRDSLTEAGTPGSPQPQGARAKLRM